jgi:AcrR family transcriptional regulator
MSNIAQVVPQGRRQRNKIANRQAILSAGLEVFSHQGFDTATISDLVKASGLSVGTFYNYFGDKESVFEALVGELATRAREALEEARRQAGSPEEFVSAAFRAYCGVIGKNPQMQAMIVRNTSAFRRVLFSGQIDGLVEDLERDMTAAMAQGMFPRFPIRMMTMAMIGAGVEVLAFENDSGATIEEKADFLGKLFVGGIRFLGAQQLGAA